MALTQITSKGIKDAEIVNADIADDTIAEAKLDIHAAPTGTDKFLKYTSNGMEWVVDNNTVYTHPNHSGEVTSTADGATVIADDTVDEANLKISNAGSNGQFLQKSDTTGGLTWATAGATLASPSITGTTDVNYSEVVTHTITNWSDDVTYTFTPTACTIGSVNTSGQFTVTIAGSGSPSYSVVASTDSLGLANSAATQKTFTIKLSAPTLNSPADTDTATNVAYTVTSTDANDDKLVLDLQSSNFNFVSTSHGSGSKVGNTVEVTGFTTNNPVVTVLITTAATYNVRAKAVKIDGSKPTSDWSSVDTIVISVPAFSATGGTVTTAGGKTIHTFTSSGNFVTVNQTGTIDYMIVAGGGGGSQGGGGAGGLIHSTSQSIAVGTHAVVVGSGGAGNGDAGNDGANGGNSSFNSETAIGGGHGDGGGGCGGGPTAGSGGSGGGSKRDCGSGGAGTSGQGHAGGNTASGPYMGAGGGGGKGGAGGNGAGGNSGSESGGAGGSGYTTSISGSSVCYAGGGGGGSANGSGGSASCGGGAGGQTGGDATDGTGGGGGGNSGAAAGDGGDGVVIISYTTP